MSLARSTPSAEVNSVMISPQPPRFRMKRRKTVSVTPAMGASTVAGRISTPPSDTEAGTWRLTAIASPFAGVSQYLRIAPYFTCFLAMVHKAKPLPKQGLGISGELVELLLFRGSTGGGTGLGVLAAEALHAPGGIHELLLAGKEGMAVRADFYVDVALMGGTGGKGVAARAMHANLVIIGMNGCFHCDS